MSSPLLFAIASLIWGSTFWAITLQLGEVAPAVSVVYRFALASAVLFAWSALRGARLRLPWRTQRWMVVQGFFTFALSYSCTYRAEQYLVSGLVAILFALMVFWTPICARIAFGARISARTWAAGAAAITGVSMLFAHSIGAAWADLQGGGKGHFLLGLCLALVATISSSAGNVLVAKVREQSADLTLTMAWTMLWGTLMVAAWTLLEGESFMLPAAPRYWYGLVYLAVFGSVIAFYAYFTLINRIGPQKAVYVGVAAPVISVLLSIQLEHYRPGPVEWLGMVICLASVAWAVRAPALPAASPAAAPAAAPALTTPTTPTIPVPEAP